MANPVLIDPACVGALREVLDDSNQTVFSSIRIATAMRDNRRTVMFRDPAYASSGINPYYSYRGRIPTPANDTETSVLQAEGDLRSYQAKPYFRHWDSNGPVVVWRNGVQKTLTTDYAVDYAEGRVIFTSDVQDWETITVTASYYPIYFIARLLLLQQIASAQGDGGKLSDQAGDDSWTYAAIKDRIQVLDQLTAAMAPRTIRREVKLY